MKKLIIALLAAVVCSTANAQDVSDGTIEISMASSFEAASPIRKYVQASLGILGVSGDDVKDMDATVGFDLLYGFEIPLGDKGLWQGVEMGIGTSRGYLYENGFEDRYLEYRHKYKITCRTYSLRLTPLNFGYRYAFNDKCSVGAHIGAGLSLDLAGGVKSEYDEYSETTSIWDIDDYRVLDVFLKVGVGVNYKRIGVDVSWQKGFIKPFGDLDAYSTNVFLSLRYNL